MEKKTFLTENLHTVILFNFAFSQPLFDLLARNSAFFVARKSQPADIISFIAAICFVFPLFIVLAEACICFFNRKIRDIFHVSLLLLLFTFIFLPLVKKIAFFSGFFQISLSLTLGIICIYLYISFGKTKLFINCLSPALLIFPLLFLFHPQIQKIILPSPPPSYERVQKTKTDIPVIMVVFDELPLTCIMDENLQIDSKNFPNFAEFSKTANWYRNATTVSDTTHLAIPAILSGKKPDLSKLPTLRDHPENLFTLLKNTHTLNVYESITGLNPEKNLKIPHYGKRILSMLSDLFVVYAHIILPDDYRKILPKIDHNWGNFRNIMEDAHEKLRDDRKLKFASFLNSLEKTEKPSLNFLHILLPHAPFTYLPSGKKYATDTGLEGCEGKKWPDDSRVIKTAFQRYMLQLCFVDSLIGKLVERLQQIDLFDPSLIVITADHGVSFRKNEYRRHVSKDNYGDIMPVPLFVKLPGQKEGKTDDRNVENIDIVPTIADILRIELPWNADGRSAVNNSLPPPKK